jgi:hypothetical protein
MKSKFIVIADMKDGQAVIGYAKKEKDMLDMVSACNGQPLIAHCQVYAFNGNNYKRIIDQTHNKIGF